MRSYNDDLVMSFAIGCWVRDTVLVENQRNIEYNRAALSTISSETRKLSTSIPGMLGHKTHNEPQRLQEAKQFVEKYMGIIKG
jgi:hypothetical protein